MTTKYLDLSGLSYLWGKLKNHFQEKLISGTNIKTINNTSLLGSGNISIQGSGGVTDVEVNGTSVVTDGVAEVEIKTINGQSLVGSGNIALPQIRKGYESLGTIPANSYQDIPITFSSAMAGSPAVICSMVSTSTSPTMGSIAVSPINVSASGFTCRVFNNTSNPRAPGCEYIAIYGG